VRTISPGIHVADHRAATARRSDHDKIRDLIATYDIPRQEMLVEAQVQTEQGGAPARAGLNR
jgi:hypothetical protein